MIKTTPHITLTAEQDKRETTICIVWASVVVFGMLALLLHGLAFLSWTVETNEEVYARKKMVKEIEILQGQMQYYGVLIDNHKHQFWTGKVK